MNEKPMITEDSGLYTTVLPPFDQSDWPKLVPTIGHVWIISPCLDLTDDFDTIVSRRLFGSTEIELRCSIHRIEYDVSIPATDFLRLVETEFRHGIDFIYSKRHQPYGFSLDSIARSSWPSVMDKTQIEFVFHRPAGGEPSLVTSFKESNLFSIIERFNA